MFGLTSRKLATETLEDRRVLNGDGFGVLPPPPIDNNVALVDFFESSGSVSADNFDSRIQIVESEFTASDAGSQSDGPAPISSGDFNGDGVTDFLSADAVGDWYLHLNDGTQLHELPVGNGISGAKLLGTADFNQDGTLDIISMHQTTGEIWVSLNQSNSFTHQKWGQFANPQQWSQLYVGDFNGDSRPDLLGGQLGGHWWLAQNHEGQTFHNYRWGRFADYAWADVLNGEFTGDQHSDVVARAPDNTWWLWEGSAGGFQHARYFGHWKIRDNWMDVSAADFNADGRDDVIGRSEDGNLWVGSSTDAGFRTWSWGNGWINGAEWSQVTILDMNGDDLPDQVGHAKDDTWWYALNTGESFQNSFWQRRGEVEFITEDFVRAQAVDLTDSLPQQEVEGLEFEAKLDDQNRIVLIIDEPISISSISVFDPNRTLLRGATGDILGFSGGNSKSVELPEERSAFTGELTLGLEWHQGRGDLDAILNFGNNHTARLQIESPPGGSGGLIDGFYTNGNVTIVDGHLVLNGIFEGITTITAVSNDGYLSLDSVDVGGRAIQLTTPFENGTVAQDVPSAIQLIVDGAAQELNLGLETATAIRYSGTLEKALSGDLTVTFGVEGINGRIQLNVDSEPFVPAPDGSNLQTLRLDPELPRTDQPEEETPTTDPVDRPSETATYDAGTFSVVDGRITLNGNFPDLAGIEFISRGQFLAQEAITIPGVGEIRLTAPFIGGAVPSSTPSHIAMGVLGAENRIDVEGDVPTSILYSGPLENAGDDLQVNIGIGDGAPMRMNFSV